MSSRRKHIVIHLSTSIVLVLVQPGVKLSECYYQVGVGSLESQLISLKDTLTSCERFYKAYY